MPPSAPFVPDDEVDADFEAGADFAVESGLEVDGLVLLDVPAAGDDFGLSAFFVGLVCADPPFCPQLVLDGEAAGLVDFLVFGLPVDSGEPTGVAVVAVAFGELDSDVLGVPVDGETGGLLAALDEAPGLLVAGGLVLVAGLLVFGDVRGEEVGEDAGQEGGAAAAWLDAVAAAPALLLLAPAAAEPATSPGALWPDPVLPLLLCPVNTEELSCTTACRSGGTAIATPIANTAHAMASAGRSMTSRMSRPLHQPARARRERARFPGRESPGPDRSVRLAGPEPPGLRSSPRSSPGTTPGTAPGAPPGTPPGSGPGAGIGSGAAFALASVGPAARILARIRSRPSGRGST